MVIPIKSALVKEKEEELIELAREFKKKNLGIQAKAALECSF